MSWADAVWTYLARDQVYAAAPNGGVVPWWSLALPLFAAAAFGGVIATERWLGRAGAAANALATSIVAGLTKCRNGLYRRLIGVREERVVDAETKKSRLGRSILAQLGGLVFVFLLAAGPVGAIKFGV
jgi:hypothetical protein